MAYERLTNKPNNTWKCPAWKDGACHKGDRVCFEIDECQTYHRLARLEDMIESGQAVILPCKVGDEVYYIHDYGFGRKKIEKMYVVGFNFSRGNKEVVVIGGYKEIAYEVFTTKEAAEARLKEIRWK